MFNRLAIPAPAELVGPWGTVVHRTWVLGCRKFVIEHALTISSILRHESEFAIVTELAMASVA